MSNGRKQWIATATILFALVALSACGGGGNDAPQAAPTPNYSVGGTVIGLVGSGLTLSSSGASLPISANGPQTYATSLANGASYNVIVGSQPTNPNQTCTVSNGSGTVSGANITNVNIACVTTPLAVASSTPLDNAANVVRTVPLTLNFSAAVNASTATSTNITLQSTAGAEAINVGTSGATVTITPARSLLPLTQYTLTITAAVRGSFGEQLASAVTMRFTTRDGAWGTASRIDSNQMGNSSYPQIAVDPNGNALAVWANFDGTRSSIGSNRYTNAGGWGSSVLIATDTAGAALHSQIACDVSGNAIAVWVQLDGTQYNIWANRFVAGGNWGSPTRIKNDATRDAHLPQIAIDSTGNALAVWGEYGDGFDSIWFNRYTAGAGWGAQAAVEVEIEQPDEAGATKFAFDSNGNALAVWSQPVGARYHIWAKRYTMASGWGPTALIQIDTTSNAYEPQIAIDSNGNALAVWMQSDGARFNIWANRYGAASGWGTAMLIEASNDGSAVAPQIAMDANGNALAVWTQSDGANYYITANRYTVGSGWGNAEVIQANRSYEGWKPSIAVDRSGNALAVWRQVDGATANIWANRYVAGSGWGVAGLIETNNIDAIEPVIAIDAVGNAVAVWQQEDGTRSTVWANQFQ